MPKSVLALTAVCSAATGKVDVYRITAQDAPLTLLQQISTGLLQSGGVMGIAYVQPVAQSEDQ